MVDLQLLGRTVLLQPPPCAAKCSSIACRHLHDYSGRSCHLQGICDACPRLLVLDKQIEELQDAIARLVKERTEIKRHVNYNHDRLLGRLPVEIISMIFVLSASSAPPKQSQVSSPTHPEVPMRAIALEPGLLLGSVCMYWRKITLTTPQLWTRLAINLSRDIGRLSLIEEWQGRSGGLRLNVMVKSHYMALPPELEPLLSLLRAHATRWALLKLSMPPNAMRDIFTSLREPTRLHFLHLKTKQVAESPLAPIVLGHVIAPAFMKLEKYFPPQTFVRWDNLRCVELESIEMDALVHIFTLGTRLEAVRASKISEQGTTYPLPSSPVVHPGVKSLFAEACETADNFLQYIRLPCLASLNYDFKLHARAHQGAHNVLVNFLRHSAPSLNVFRFNYKVEVDYDAFYYGRDQWEALPQITTLEIDITSGEGEEGMLVQEDEMSNFINAFFRELAHDRQRVVLPNLQCLIVKTNLFAPETWPLLGDIIPPSAPASSSESNTIDVSALTLDHGAVLNPVHEYKRPLKKIILKMRVGAFWEDYMPESLWLRFVDLRRKGLTFIVEGPDGLDLFARMPEWYDFEDVDNSYDESETSSDNSDSEADTDGSYATDSEAGAEGSSVSDSDAEDPRHDVDAE